MVLIATMGNVYAVQSSASWRVIGATEKVTPMISLSEMSLSTLHAARGEYAPFQIVINAPQEQLVIVDISANIGTLTLYQEQFLPLPIYGEAEFYAASRLYDVEALPDALIPFNGTTPANELVILWSELRIAPDAPTGTHSIVIRVGDESHTIDLTVYDVLLPASGGIDIIVPLEVAWTIPFYAESLGVSSEAYHQQINTILVNHYFSIGSWVAQPTYINGSWDFSAFDTELTALPPNTQFLAPLPYDRRTGTYYFTDSNGNPITETNFDDTEFVRLVTTYYQDLAAYLTTQGRLEDAWVYPTDQRRWVADEPIHDGMFGYTYLAQWTQIIREAGLRVIASGVTPAAVGDPALGWITGDQAADNYHVHADQFDANPPYFMAWGEQNPNQSTSLYLNEYGDLVDMPAAIHRGMMWHSYGRSVSLLMGYAALEWVTENYELLLEPVSDTVLAPVSGYGGGALIYPDGSPSLRLKWLREGIEDTRLLDLYADMFGLDAMQSIVQCLTSEPLALQVPTIYIWDDAHQAILHALTTEEPIDLASCSTLPDLNTTLVDVSETDLGDWEQEGVTLTRGEGGQVQALFEIGVPSTGYWFGEQDLTGCNYLGLNITTGDPYFSRLDVGLADGDGNYILLRQGATWLAPTHRHNLRFPLITPINESFSWSNVAYIAFEVNTETEQTNAFGDTQIFPLGQRTLWIDDVRLSC